MANLNVLLEYTKWVRKLKSDRCEVNKRKKKSTQNRNERTNGHKRFSQSQKFGIVQNVDWTSRSVLLKLKLKSKLKKRDARLCVFLRETRKSRKICSFHSILYCNIFDEIIFFLRLFFFKFWAFAIVLSVEAQEKVQFFVVYVCERDKNVETQWRKTENKTLLAKIKIGFDLHSVLDLNQIDRQTDRPQKHTVEAAHFNYSKTILSSCSICFACKFLFSHHLTIQHHFYICVHALLLQWNVFFFLLSLSLFPLNYCE